MKMRGYTDERHYMQVDALYHYLHGESFPPVMVEIDPSGVCNHKCHFCYSQYRVGREQLPTDVLHRIIDELADFGVKSILWQGSGEPLMHKGLPEVIEHAGKRGLSQTLTTNGALFTPDVQERIIPHLHYMRFSVIDHHRLDANILAAVAYRAAHKYEIYFTATVYLDETNFHDAYNIVGYYKELGLDYIVIEQRKAVMRYINTTPPEGSECSVCNHWKANNRIYTLVNRTKWSDFLI